MPSSTSPHPDQRGVEPHPEPPKNVNGEVDYVPHPERSISISPTRAAIQKSIIALYGGSASEDDMKVYAEQAIYDDPFSYCDTRYKIAGQWYGIPKLFAKSETLATEVTASTEHELVWKQRQKYTFAGVHASKIADSLISLRLEGKEPNEKVVYHKDMWNSKDYSHEGLGMLIKKLNGDKLTNITKPPESI
ncbi:hypothetical protein AFCA_012763 [Aspergillus flavus]|uniref:Uncharacterized protein n=2 Tax=Aspergillus subgen. Circumdati TaxID=2720871 RepID=A0A1S9DFR1_ASPOZ|nr:hypothetical protein OAory_01042340 [Aspergillus oryzae]QMW48379.1 hypothetical protein G4B11_011897 [Aspergillus flavus]RAQ53057.1 hypothetical protein AFGD_001433 [Aspergillus flavus]RAQ58106.1 hypothetical protein COH20_007685 [Aspergillus flavus]RAQ78204.1 hypothetical protein COH21_009979 [Aspergillus flavus]